ncbi:MAG TPA: right-handed parallel beta-helix repeat-containing protein [Pilimelia sp.]|nr:right-handed parallel beta-helix repeat-containing protein [Pilimelia sp.]
MRSDKLKPRVRLVRRLAGCGLTAIAVGAIAVPAPNGHSVGAAAGSSGAATVSPGPVGPPAPPPKRPSAKALHRHIVQLVPHQFAVITKPELLRGTTRRTIVLNRGGVTLWHGEWQIWTGYFPTGRPNSARSLADVADLVARSPRPGWLTRVKPDVYLLRVALTQAPRTRLVVAAPRVRELRLLSGGEVYVSGVAARVRFDGTRVLSWRRDGQGPDTTADRRRPFVAYKHQGSVLDIYRSQFSYLGGDVSHGYGVSWAPGSTGSAIDSTFDHNFFGAYTSAAVGVVFRRNVFHSNDLYGLDPHTGSRELVVDDNEAYGNGSHGIIFSKDVVHSSVTRNRSHHNAANGIMMDVSDDNVVADNRSWDNDGDGIVVQQSARTTVRGNHVTGNRVGVRVTARSPQTTIDRNRITGNRTGVEIYNVARGPGALVRPITVTNNEIDGDRDNDGVVLQNAVGVRIIGNTVSGHRYGVRFRYGIRVAGLCRDIMISRNRVAYQRRGIQIGDRVSEVSLSRNDVSGASEYGMVLGGFDVTSTNDRVSTSRDGMLVRGRINVRDVTVSGARYGVVLADGPVLLVGADIRARHTGLLVAGSSGFDLQASRVHGRSAIVGADPGERRDNTLTSTGPPVPMLAVAGVALIVVAFFLHLAQRIRSPSCHVAVAQPPPGVRNAT